jgi:PhnB protein
MADVKPIPDGYHSLTPYLIIDGAADALEYYKKAFGATELFRMEHGGKIGHAEMKIGDSPFMLADGHPEMGYKGPKAYGGTPVSLMIYVEDCDTVYKQAIDAGATEVKPLQDQFYGDRSGTLTDPFGHVWTIATHKEDVTPEEMDKRMAAAHGG